MNPVTKALYHDFKTIAYRPELRAITNSVTATILLQQVFFRWVSNDGKPFYKFKEPCNHKLYKNGDSWCEELGFSRAEFDTAWKALSATGIASKKTNMERLTYYTLNESAFDCAVNAVYSVPQKRDIPALRKETIQRHVKTDSSVCSYTENTPEITSKNKEDHFNFWHSPLAGECSQTPNEFDECANIDAGHQRQKNENEFPDTSEYLEKKAAKQASKPAKAKREQRALFANQVSRNDYPCTKAALYAIERHVAQSGGKHNFWVDANTSRPVIQLDHIAQVERNLTDLAEYFDTMPGTIPERAVSLMMEMYEVRGAKHKVKGKKTPVDLAFLACIGLKDPHSGCDYEGMDLCGWFANFSGT